MGVALIHDTCNATRRERALLLICELPMNHDQDHRCGVYAWPLDSVAGVFRWEPGVVA